MDEEKLNQLGIRPLTGELNRIRALKDKKACRC
jgi:predicted metalloendopeptidase